MRNKNYLLILSLLINYSCENISKQESISYDSSGKYKIFTERNSSEIKNGIYYELNIKNNIFKTIGNYNYDRKNGIWINYYQNGNINNICYYKNDTISGRNIAFYPDKNIQYITTYYQNEGNGTQITYYDLPNLIIKSILHFEDGKIVSS